MIDPLILARGVHITATVLAFGTICFVTLVADVPELRRRLNAVVWGALAAAVVSGAGWLVLLAAQIFGAPIVEVCLHGGLWQVATETRFGWIWGARLVLGGLLGALLVWPAARWLQLAVATLLIALLAFIGHAGATPGLAGRIHLAADMAHLVAAGAWLGGLPAFVLMLSWARRRSESGKSAIAVAATRRFSMLAMAGVATLLASGAVNSWNLLSGPRDLIATDYGQLVSLKTGLFAAMVCIGAVNKYHLSRQIPASGPMFALQRNSLFEIGLGICVLLLVGALGTFAPTAHHHLVPTAIPADAAFVHIHTAEAMADVTISPDPSGTAVVKIRVSREDFAEFPAKSVSLGLDPPGGGAGGLEGSARRMADGTWTIERLETGQRGIWTARVIVTSEAGKSLVLDAPIVIGP